MQGKRLKDGVPPKNAGEYSWMAYDNWAYRPEWMFGEGEWHIIAPDGKIGAIGRITKEKPAAHSVTIHEDGQITVTPSLVMPSGWHGWLNHGVFSSV